MHTRQPDQVGFTGPAMVGAFVVELASGRTVLLTIEDLVRQAQPILDTWSFASPWQPGDGTRA